MTPFSFETELAAASISDVVRAYFDPDHLAAQDRVAEQCDRKVLEDSDGELVRKASWSVRAVRPLPLLARRFVEGGRIVYVETLTWRKRDDAIDLKIVPQILGGRIVVTASENLELVGERRIRRHYRGQINVDLNLVSRVVERRILVEITKSIPVMRDCTQAWLAQLATVPKY